MNADKQYYLDMFIKNYNTIKNMLGVEYVNEKIYNKHRPKGSPTSAFISKLVVGSKCYTKLIDLSMVNPHKFIKYNISVDLLDSNQLNELNETLNEITNRLEESKKMGRPNK